MTKKVYQESQKDPHDVDERQVSDYQPSDKSDSSSSTEEVDLDLSYKYRETQKALAAQKVADPENFVAQKPKEIPKKKSTPVATRRTHSEQDRIKFFEVYDDRCDSVAKIAKELNIPPNVASSWVKSRNKGEVSQPRRGPRKHDLGDEHKSIIENAIEEDPTVSIKDMVDGLKESFADLDISQTSVYNFVTKDCGMSYKQAGRGRAQKNSPKIIESRYRFAKDIKDSASDYLRGCVFLGEVGFFSGMKHTRGWAPKGITPVIKSQETKPVSTSILGAISWDGIVSLCVRDKSLELEERKKAGEEAKEEEVGGPIGIITGHFMQLLQNTLQYLDRSPEFKNCFLIMNQAPIHTHPSVKELIELRGYRCLYLPSQSPGLNPIEQYLSLLKKKLDRKRMLEYEPPCKEIMEASYLIDVQQIRRFFYISTGRLQDCLERKPI